MIFTARQLQEKCQEQNVDLYMTFVDLTKAFDTVSREGLWQIMAKFGCPAKFIAMVRQFHDGMLARVQKNPGRFARGSFRRVVSPWVVSPLFWGGSFRPY